MPISTILPNGTIVVVNRDDFPDDSTEEVVYTDPVTGQHRTLPPGQGWGTANAPLTNNPKAVEGKVAKKDPPPLGARPVRIPPANSPTYYVYYRIDAIDAASAKYGVSAESSHPNPDKDQRTRKQVFDLVISGYEVRTSEIQGNKTLSTDGPRVRPFKERWMRSVPNDEEEDNLGELPSWVDVTALMDPYQ